MPSLVRVSLGIATHNRETYLADANRSGLSQDFADPEVLVAVDWSANPKVNEVPSQFASEERMPGVRRAASPVGFL